MKLMKTVLFVPGFRENLETRNYRGVIKAIEGRGYKVVFVPINWRRTLLDDWVKELDAVYSKYDPKQTILAGFSFGAMTTFMSAIKRAPSELWLFSFSPYFSDDIPNMKKSWLRNIGHRRADAFRALDFYELAKGITCKTLIMLGAVEAGKHPLIDSRSATAHRVIKNSRLVMVPNADHDVADPNYIRAIKESI
jgi:pimeloyl-ACP methyl ester carboxylesterase